MATDNNRNLKCNDCGQTFTRGSALATHIKFKHNGYKIKQTECKYGCGTSTHTTSTLVKHEKNCWLKPENITHCECCNVLIERVVTKNGKDERKYCGSSCAAKVSNSNREVTWADKTRESINEFYDKDPRYRNYERINKIRTYRKLVERYGVRQMKDLKPEMYEYWQSNPYTGSGDTSRLSVEHIKPIIECFEEGWPVEQAGDISNLEIIPYRENNLRYKKRKKSLTFRF
jgi:hypothetical protein